MSEQKPTVGRIVHFNPSPPNPAKGQPYAATITHVFGDTCVNLEVHNDGSFPLSPGALHPTSVTIGTGPYTWAWPSRA